MERREGFSRAWSNLPHGGHQCLRTCCLQFGVSGVSKMGGRKQAAWVRNYKYRAGFEMAILFPQDSKTAAQWFHIVQHRGQARYYKDHELDVLLLGRRRADGNYVGKGENIYTNGQGVTRYSPLSEWSHEQVLAFIHYYNVALPPIYEWKNGYLCGTHPWAARQWTGSIENGWKEVYEIDRSVVKEAAEHIPSAKVFLESGVM